MARRESAGFALLEVVVAIALLGIVALPIAETIGAGVHYAGAAEATRRSLGHASSIAEAARSGTVDASGWREIEPSGRVCVTMTLTAPGCPVAGVLPGKLAQTIAEVDGVGDVEVRLTWDPTWEMSMMSEAARVELNMF